MRILALNFKNLNSLQGEWHIDFRHPTYSENGIFAITGQTGAGKSTILDAICLALYGQTPRLGELTQTRNDLMSRQTGECWAKVIFSTQGKTYLCEWSQNRARGKADGKLQSPKHSISDYMPNEKGENTGNILEEKAKFTKEKVHTITGMDFLQFTRSMLLAQGSFAVFLQAKSEERSDILEQITGSKIYSEISIRVQKKSAEEKKQLDNLTAQQSGMMLLSPEEEQTLTAEQQALTEQSSTIQKHITTLNTLKNWQTALHTTQIEQAKNQHEQAQLEQQIQQFAPQRQRLNLAQKALEVAGEYAKLQYDRQQQQRLLSQQHSWQQQLPNLQQQLISQQHSLTQAEHSKKASQTAWQIAQPNLNTAKKLSVQIEELSQQLNQNKNQHKSKLNEQNALEKHIQNSKDELKHYCYLKSEYQQQQQHLAHHAILPEVLANLRQYQQSLINNEQQLTSLHQQQKNTQQSLTGIHQALSSKQQQIASLTEHASTLKHQLDSQHTHLAERLAQKTAEFWQSQANGLLQAKMTLGQLLQQQQQQQQLHQEQQSLSKQQQQIQLALNTLTSQVEQAETAYQQQRHIVALLDEKQLLQAKIASYEHDREKLVTGKPCPLCGATEHPFSTQNFSHVNTAIQQEIAMAKQQLIALENQRNALVLEQNSLSKDTQEIKKNLTKTEQNLSINIGQLRQNLNEFNQQMLASEFLSAGNAIANPASLTKLKALAEAEYNNFDLPEFAELLINLQSILEQQQTAINTKLEQIHGLQQNINQLKTEFDTHSQQLYQLEKSHSELLNQQKIATQNQQYLSQQLAQLQQHAHTIFQQVLQQVKPFTGVLTRPISNDFSENFVVELSQLIEELTQHQQAWQQLEQNLRTTEQSIAAAQSRLSEQQSVFDKNSVSIQQTARQLAQSEQVLADKHTERFALIGDLVIEAEEQRLANMLHEAQQAVFTAQQSVHKTEQTLHNLQAQLANIDIEKNQLINQINQQQQALLARWQGLGFADETAFLQANLAEHERQQLTSIAREQDDRGHFLSRQRQDLDDKLATLRQHSISESAKQKTHEAIQAELAEQEQALLSLQQTLGSIGQKLQHNQTVKANQSALAEQIQTQQKIWRNWHNLYELIGSSDGKKFRNFAQGLTFNVMINHANSQLQRMNDRYLLVADSQNPLELNVIDNYQGGEIRTSKNLSGGESFIISLALALGLSSMASRQVQVDSLFLDEGFGTLDTEALDTALDTLTSLQQSGKLIGVISHVQELKDRITTQIVVEKIRGGVSKISGIGVKKV